MLKTKIENLFEKCYGFCSCHSSCSSFSFHNFSIRSFARKCCLSLGLITKSLSLPHKGQGYTNISFCLTQHSATDDEGTQTVKNMTYAACMGKNKKVKVILASCKRNVYRNIKDKQHEHFLLCTYLVSRLVLHWVYSYASNMTASLIEK